MKEAKISIPVDVEKTPCNTCKNPNFKTYSVANARLGQCEMYEEMYSSDYSAEMTQDINE